MYWREAAEDGHSHAKTMASTVCSTALALSACAVLRPDHLLSREATTAATGSAVELNGQPIASGQLSRGQPAATLEIAADGCAQGPTHSG